MNNSILRPKGVYWNELSNAEKKEIETQLKNIYSDANYTAYRYYKTRFDKWIICNAFTLPMKTSKVNL